MHKSRSILQKIPPLRLAVYLISAALFIAMAVIAVRQGMAGWPEEGPAVVLGNAALWLVPFVLGPPLRRYIGDSLWLLFAVFAFFASFLGTIMRFYENIWWYDLAMHTVFGYIGCLIGLFFACKLADIYALRPLLIALFCFCVSLMFAALWEVFEFAGDLLLGNNAQGDPVQTVTGELFIPVNDTMEDIICNLTGAVLFLLHYGLHRLSRRSLGFCMFIPVNDTMEDIICNLTGAVLFLLHYGLHRLSRRSLGFCMFMKDFSIGKKPSPAENIESAAGFESAAELKHAAGFENAAEFDNAAGFESAVPAVQSAPTELSPAQTTVAAMRGAPSEAPAGADLAPTGLSPLQDAPAKAPAQAPVQARAQTRAHASAPQTSPYTEEN